VRSVRADAETVLHVVNGGLFSGFSLKSERAL
jgi:hypothetical protein